MPQRSDVRSLLVLLLSGCAVPMSTLHTGRTVPQGKFEGDLASGMNVDSQFLGGTVGAGKLAAGQAVDAAEGDSLELDDDDFDTIGRASLAWSLAPPLPVTEARLRYGVIDHLELGGTWSSAGFGLHTKVQILDRAREEPVDLAVAFMAHRSTFDLGIPDQLAEVLDLEEMSRTDLAVPVSVGRDLGENGRIGFVYTGVKAQLTLLQADMVEHITDVAGKPSEISGPMWGGGVFFGGGVGYKYAFLTFELDVSGYHFRPEIAGRELRYGGVTVYPVIGLRLRGWDPDKVAASDEAESSG